MVVASPPGSLISLATYEHLYAGSGRVDELTGQVKCMMLLSGAAWGALLLREQNAPAWLACAVELPLDIASTIDNGDIDSMLDRAQMLVDSRLNGPRSISGLRRRVRADLAGQREGGYPLGETARDGGGLMAVGVDRLRGKKTGGAGPSAQRR